MTSALSNTYSRLPVAFTHGKGVWLWDTKGRRYLDAMAGIGVSCLGHAHPKLVAAISEQAARVIHVSNLYEVPEQEELAQRMIKMSGMTEIVFGNSGAEANEAAIKLARYYGYKKGNDLPTIITMESSWHGRTIGTLAATDSEKARTGFGPLPGGFIKVAYNDLAAIKAAGDAEPRVVAVLLEVLQGEGGIRPTDVQNLKDLRALCNARGWLMMIDEVQSGIGRTGKWLAHQWAGILPDVVVFAKGLGGGVPIGAIGACGPAGIATLRALEEENLLENAATVGAYLKAELGKVLLGTPGVREVRGQGLMLGIELEKPCGVLTARALEAGLLINVTRDRVVRLLPPLILTTQEADEIVKILVPLIKAFNAETA
jgi:acetylornithine/N-succinyldiaminopimelate aminotransferase